VCMAGRGPGRDECCGLRFYVGSLATAESKLAIGCAAVTGQAPRMHAWIPLGMDSMVRGFKV
jgi:hypothetical protein